MKPLKRHPLLVPLSQEHHQALSLCARILREPNRNHQVEINAHYPQLERHFVEEETMFAPWWDKLPDDSLRERFEREHAMLRQMFAHADFDDADWNRAFATLLRDHARFEERVLFEKLAQFALGVVDEE